MALDLIGIAKGVFNVGKKLILDKVADATKKNEIEAQLATMEAQTVQAATEKELELAKLDNDLRELQTKIQLAEIKSDDNYTKRWRPTLGYGFTVTVVGGTLFSLVMAWIVWITAYGHVKKLVEGISDPTVAVTTFSTAVASIGPFPTIETAALLLMLSALGVNVGFRSLDKFTRTRNGNGKPPEK